jgi:hypothetical protein
MTAQERRAHALQLIKDALPKATAPRLRRMLKDKSTATVVRRQVYGELQRRRVAA